MRPLPRRLGAGSRRPPDRALAERWAWISGEMSMESSSRAPPVAASIVVYPSVPCSHPIPIDIAAESLYAVGGIIAPAILRRNVGGTFQPGLHIVHLAQ